MASKRYDICPWRYLILKLSLRASLTGKELLFASAIPIKNKRRKRVEQIVLLKLEKDPLQSIWTGEYPVCSQNLIREIYD
jgi:hypothetical protein